MEFIVFIIIMAYGAAPGCMQIEDYTSIFGERKTRTVEYLWFRDECSDQFPDWHYPAHIKE